MLWVNFSKASFYGYNNFTQVQYLLQKNSLKNLKNFVEIKFEILSFEVLSRTQYLFFFHFSRRITICYLQ